MPCSFIGFEKVMSDNALPSRLGTLTPSTDRTRSHGMSFHRSIVPCNAPVPTSCYVTYAYMLPRGRHDPLLSHVDGLP